MHFPNPEQIIANFPTCSYNHRFIIGEYRYTLIIDHNDGVPINNSISRHYFTEALKEYKNFEKIVNELPNIRDKLKSFMKIKDDLIVDRVLIITTASRDISIDLYTQLHCTNGTILTLSHLSLSTESSMLLALKEASKQLRLHIENNIIA